VAAQIKLNEKKFKELVVYLAAKNASNPAFGKTKLNKLLFFSDFTAYARLGSSITGVQYIKLQFGPCPRSMKQLTEALMKEGRVVSQELTSGPYEGSRLVALRDADLQEFSGPEIAIVDEIVERYWSHSGRDISDASHGFVGWGLAELNSEIPYYTALIPDRPVPPSTGDFMEALRRSDALYGPELNRVDRAR
jgi:hypothetical protein